MVWTHPNNNPLQLLFNFMKDSLRNKLLRLSGRLTEIDGLLAQPDIINDREQYKKLTKEHADLSPVVTLFIAYQQYEQDAEAATSLLSDSTMKELAEAEIEECKAQLETIQADIQKALLPTDPNDDRNIFLEIRAGTGGDESALFAGDLFRMYARFAERNRWQLEIISENAAELGGYKEVIARIVGKGAYSKMKFESGTHRVQRVPETEAQGRIHTSAATVAVLPEADEADAVDLNPADLRIDTFRASGAGGQHINKTDSAVRITHIPTGTVVECQDDRSQHKNKAQAMSVLVARIRDKQLSEQQSKQAAERKLMVGSGDRSERIRTYNFPQGRITDHRIKLTVYNLAEFLDGEIGTMIEALATEYQAEQLIAMESDQES